MKVSVTTPDQRLVVAVMTCVGTARPWNARGVLWNKIQVLKIIFSEIFLDVDCSHLNYSTPVAEEVLAAAKKVNILLSFKVSVVGSYWQFFYWKDWAKEERLGWRGGQEEKDSPTTSSSLRDEAARADWGWQGLRWGEHLLCRPLPPTQRLLT